MSRNGDPKPFNYWIRLVVASTLPTIIAWRKARFPAEELRKMAGIGVADVEGDFHHALLCLSEQAAPSPSGKIKHGAGKDLANT